MALRRPTGAIRWAGTQTTPMCTGFVEGAIRFGAAASEEVLELLGAAESSASPGEG